MLNAYRDWYVSWIDWWVAHPVGVWLAIAAVIGMHILTRTSVEQKIIALWRGLEIWWRRR